MQNNDLPPPRGRPRRPPNYSTPLDLAVKAQLLQKTGKIPTQAQVTAETEKILKNSFGPLPPFNKSAFNQFNHALRVAHVLDPTLPARRRRRALHAIKADDLV